MASIGNHSWATERFTLDETCTVKLIYLDGDERPTLQYYTTTTPNYGRLSRGLVRMQVSEEEEKKRPIADGCGTIAIPKGTILTG